MKPFVEDSIERYAHDLTQSFGALHDELREYTLAHVPLPQMQVGRVEGRLLKMLASLCGARRILEVGTYTGYSSLCMAEALPEDGEIITCDHDEAVAKIARSFFDRSSHGHKIRIKLGDGLETIRALDTSPFDMAFLDADKSRYPLYYDEIVPRLRPGGLLVIDNVLWSGEVLDPKTDDARGIVEVGRRVHDDPRVENLLITVRDGVLLARKLP
ncbi:MAG: class I SAM-dependent methyltransferase [Polyangiaceae bacterium]